MAEKSNKKTASTKRTASKKQSRPDKPTARKAPVPKGGGDWQADTLARVRALMFEALPGVVEEVKWRKPSNAMQGVPVWSDRGIICTGETYKAVVKLTFAKGASLPDPANLFNSSLEGNTRRAIDIREGEAIDEAALKALIRAAAALNTAKPARTRPPRRA